MSRIICSAIATMLVLLISIEALAEFHVYEQQRHYNFKLNKKKP